MNDNELFQALASSYRREILVILQGGELSAGEIAGQLSISQPSVSRHLDLLRRSHLLSSRRQANQILYALAPGAAREAAARVERLFPKDRHME